MIPLSMQDDSINAKLILYHCHSFFHRLCFKYFYTQLYFHHPKDLNLNTLIDLSM